MKASILLMYDSLSVLKFAGEIVEVPRHIIGMAVDDAREIEECRQLMPNIGVGVYFDKPMDERALIQSVERWVGQNPAVSPSRGWKLCIH